MKRPQKALFSKYYDFRLLNGHSRPKSPPASTMQCRPEEQGYRFTLPLAKLLNEEESQQQALKTTLLLGSP